VVLNERTKTLFGVVLACESVTQPLKDGRERLLLNEIEQLFFRLAIVIQPGQRHATGTRQIAHRSGSVALFVEDFGRMPQYLALSAVEARVCGAWILVELGTSQSRSCTDSDHNRTNVRIIITRLIGRVPVCRCLSLVVSRWSSAKSFQAEGVPRDDDPN